MRFADSNATVVRRGARGWGGRCCARGSMHTERAANLIPWRLHHTAT